MLAIVVIVVSIAERNAIESPQPRYSGDPRPYWGPLVTVSEH
jgi:hypothetical protein